MPAINAAPAGNWISLGRTDGGVKVQHTQDVKELYVDQALMAVKTIRTRAGLEVSFSLAEITLERYAKVLNDATVTDIAPGGGNAGHRSFPLSFTGTLKRFAMLVRGDSPYMDANMQYELAAVVQAGNPEITFTKENMAVLAVRFMAQEDTNNPGRFGVLRAQDAAPV